MRASLKTGRVSRRLAAFIVLTGLLSGVSSLAHAQYVDPSLHHDDYGSMKMVVPVTTGDPKVWQMKLANIRNALDASARFGGTLDVRVVLYSSGILLLNDPAGPTKEAVDALRKDGVRFEVCNNSLKGMDMDYHRLNGVTPNDIVPSGFLEVGFLEKIGYAVAPMN